MSRIPENILLAGIPICGLFVLLVILLRQVNRKRQKLLVDRLQAAADEEAIQLSLIEVVGKRGIGLDQKRQKLLFIDETDRPARLINLQEINGCQVLKNRSFRAVRTIHLHLFDAQGNLAHELLFYQEFIDSDLKLKRFERQSKKWQELINNHRSHH